MLKKTAIGALVLLLATQVPALTPAQAARFKTETKQQAVGLLLPAVQAFAAAPRTTNGTCNMSGEWGCDMDEFIAGCEETGGLSTEPGGGVSCELSPID